MLWLYKLENNMQLDKYSTLINKACEKLKRIKNLNIYFFSKEFYGIHKYSHEYVYKLNIIINDEPFTIYAEENSLNHWGAVPWSGNIDFRPANFQDWPEDKKLMLAWCWAIYRYYKSYNERRPSPPPLEE